MAERKVKVVGNRTQGSAIVMIVVNLLSALGVIDRSVITPEMMELINQILTGAVGLFLALKVKNNGGA